MFGIGHEVRVEERTDLGVCVVTGVDEVEGGYTLLSKASGALLELDGSFVWDATYG